MPGKFCIYSTDVSPTLEPYNESPSPTELIRLDQDPINTGSYEIEDGTVARGSIRPTMGGVQVQQLPSFDSDSTIRISDQNAISEPVRNQLKSAYQGSGEYFFTDGYECWRVAFRKDQSLRLQRNLALAYFGKHVFNYEFSLQVLSKEI